MNKMFKKIITAVLGLAMVIGAGFAIAHNNTNPTYATAGSKSYGPASFSAALPNDGKWTGAGGGSYCGGYGKNKANAWSVTLDFNSATNIDWDTVDFSSSVSLNSTVKAAGNSASGNVTLSIDNTASDSVTKSISNFGSGSNAASAKEVAMNLTSIASQFSHVTIDFPAKSFITQYSCTLNYTIKESKELQSISIQTAPTKTVYQVGEFFDPTGLVINRNYTDLTSDTYSYAGHTAQFSFEPNLTTVLTVENTSISITYNEKTTAQPILVRTVTGVELLGDMSNKSYRDGDEWDLTGLYLSITWNAGEPNPTTVNLNELTKDTDYLLNKEVAKIGDTSLEIVGIYAGFDFEKTITGITVAEQPVEDLLRTDDTSLDYSSNSYGSVSGITKVGHSDIKSDTTYAGYLLRAVSPRLGAMQLNPSKGTYICTTLSSQLLKSITVDFNNSHSYGVKFFVSNEAYTASYNENGSNSSVELGTLNNDGTLNVTGDYKYFYMIPLGTTYVDSITVEWKLAKEEIAATLKTKASLAYSGYTDNGDGTFGYENLAIRFTGYVEENLWDRLDDESKVNGYGILLTTTEYLDGQVEKDLKNYYATADGSNVKKFDNTDTVHEPALKTEPTLKNGYYVWNLFKTVPLEDATEDYVAVAYIKLISGEVLFLDDIETSVKKLAQALIAGPERDENSLGGSLNYLANL